MHDKTTLSYHPAKLIKSGSTYLDSLDEFIKQSSPKGQALPSPVFPSEMKNRRKSNFFTGQGNEKLLGITEADENYRMSIRKRGRNQKR